MTLDSITENFYIDRSASQADINAPAGDDGSGNIGRSGIARYVVSCSCRKLDKDKGETIQIDCKDIHISGNFIRLSMIDPSAKRPSFNRNGIEKYSKILRPKLGPLIEKKHRIRKN